MQTDILFIQFICAYVIGTKQKTSTSYLIIEHIMVSEYFSIAIVYSYMYESVTTSDILDVDNYRQCMYYIYITGLRMGEGAKTARLLLNFLR